MAGKKKLKSDAKQDTRGGARAGAGKPPNDPIDYDERFKTLMLEALESIEDKTKIPVIEDLITDVLAGDKAAPKVALLKAIATVFVIPKRKSESKIEKVKGSKIIMPERRPDPANVIPIDKKSKGGKS